jgi:hypothetical protein
MLPFTVVTTGWTTTIGLSLERPLVVKTVFIEFSFHEGAIAWFFLTAAKIRKRIRFFSIFAPN